MSDWWSKIVGKENIRKSSYPRGSYVPSMQDKLHTEAHGSGVPVWIDWDSKTVFVKFYDGYQYEYSWDDIEGTYTDRYGGVYMLKY